MAIVTKEAAVLSACRQLLNLLKAQGKLTYKRIHVAPIIRGGGRGALRFQRNVDMAGMADLLIFFFSKTLQCAVTVHGECKSDSGRQEPAQKAWQEELASIGHHEYHLFRGVNDLRLVLAKHGIDDGFYREMNNG